MPRVAYLVNAKPTTGVGYQAFCVKNALRDAAPQFQLTEYFLNGEEQKLVADGRDVVQARRLPGLVGSKSVTWVRLGLAWRRVAAQQPFDIFHATNQTLSFMLKRRHPSVVTVHDIIELLEPQAKGISLLHRYLYSGIIAADHVIAVSQHTARTLRDYYGLSSERISVVYNGVGEEFHPLENFRNTVAYQTLRHELKIPADYRLVLYVGSDHPRKNVVTAVRAFARALQTLPRLIFIKVGEAGLRSGRQDLLREIDVLKKRDSIRFVGAVSTERLNELYNAGDVLLYPSRFEGFGLPPLQAMAAGVPVLTSNATSLPEVVGDDHQFGERAALIRDSDDVEGFAEDLMRVLQDESLAEDLRKRGVARARRFSWVKTARGVATVYKNLVEL